MTSGGDVTDKKRFKEYLSENNAELVKIDDDDEKQRVLSRRHQDEILKANEELERSLEEKESLLRAKDALVHSLSKEKNRAEDLYSALKEQMAQRESAYRAMLESQSRYRELVEVANDIIYRTDAAGFFTYVNPVGLRLSGYSENEVIGKHYTDLVDSQHRASVERFYGIQFLKRTPSTYHEYPFVAKTGEVIWLGQHVQLLSDGEQITGFQAIARDIGDRKRVQEALRKSEERLDLALKGADLGLWDYNIQTGEAFVSARRAEMVGYSLDEVEPHITWWGKQVHPEDLDRVRKAFNAHVKVRTQVYECEQRLRHKSGEYIWVLSRGRIVEWDEQGNPTRIVGTTLDISDRKRTEEALRQSEARFREFAEAVPQTVFEIDAHGNIVFINRTGLVLGGYGPGDVDKGLTLASLIAPEDFPRLIENLRVVLEGGSTSGTEYTIILKDGTRVPVAAYSTPVVKDKKVVGVRGVCVDVTKLKEAEEVLRRSRDEMERLVASRTSELQIVNDELAALNKLGREIGLNLSLDEMVYRALSTAVSVVDSDCGMLFLSKDNVLTLQGYVSGELNLAAEEFPIHRVGQCLCGLSVLERTPLFSTNIHEDPRCTWEECKRAGLRSVATIPLLTGEEILGVLALGSFRSKDFSSREEFLQSLAQTVAIGLKNALLFEEVEKNVLQLADRVAELNRSNEEREVLQKQLVQAQKMEAIGRLAGGIAHDFNNLLTVIAGYTDMLITQSLPGSPEAEKLLHMRLASDRAAGLTRQLLAFGRRQVLEVRVLDLNEVVRNLEKMFSRLMTENVDLVTALTASPASVKADDNQIGQVLINLVVNARDAMLLGGKLTIETSNVLLDESYSLTHSEVEPGRYVVLAVSDTGTGMDAETQARIFDPFFTTKEKGVGTGLGLSTVFGIAKQHGGHVSVYSEPGLGSTFRVYFPQAEAAENETSQESAPLIVRRGGETVLVVEDDESVRDFTCNALGNLGYVFLKAHDPAAAIAICEEYPGKIDLTLTDVVLPQMDGRSLFKRLALRRPDMRVLYMSGYTDDAIVNHGVLDEGVHFLQKPFSVDGLGAKISAVLGELAPQFAKKTSLRVAAGKEIEEAVTLERIRALPPELPAQLRRAAEEANRSKTSDVLERVREQDEILAASLTGLLQRFRFDRIIELIQKLEGPK